MKQQLQAWLLVLTIAAFVVSGCRKDDHIIYTDTSFILTVTEYISETDNVGYFTSTGDPTTAGTYVMEVDLVGTDSLHCSQVLTVQNVGTITILSDCSLTTMAGTWYITEGTGAYANLKGNGSLIMSFPTELAPEEIEALYGKTWRKE
ncbi:MAG TPA: hypothetical protein VD794_00860 [Flavisolibacter sp.]|nr:hypothetical protein [Flavisolibacter sp.]